MSLTGPSESPGLGPPAPLIPALDRLSLRLGGGDLLTHLGTKAAIAGLSRRGRISCGGATRLLPSRDGYVAITLARPDDGELVPALIEAALDPDADPWHAIGHWCSTATSDAVEQRAALLGIAAAVLPAVSAIGDGNLLVTGTAVDGSPARRDPMTAPVVVDLSSLWAGPLCGALLADAGCTVIKVESTQRPDGTRAGPQQFFDHLNGQKMSVALDFRSREGVAALQHLLSQADVVIEASRPRALHQLGIDVQRTIAEGPHVWASITAHGYAGPDGERIGFGDDVAVAAGLVSRDPAGGYDGPWFCADAIADPLTGIAAAASILEALGRGGRWHLDLSMCQAARAVAGPTLGVPAAVTPAAPVAPLVAHRAPPMGEHTRYVLERWCTATS